MNPLALPTGTMVSVTFDAGTPMEDSATLERTARGFIERDYHCIDCAAVWEEHEGVLVVKHEGSHVLDRVPSLLVEDGPWRVEAVPAAWLSERLDAITSWPLSAGPRDAVEQVRAVAVDAGLS